MKKKLIKNGKISRRNFFRFSTALTAGAPLAGYLSTPETTKSAAISNLDEANILQIPDNTPIQIESLNGQVQVEFFLQADRDIKSVPHYRVLFNNKPLISASRLAVALTQGPALGGACSIESVK